MTRRDFTIMTATRILFFSVLARCLSLFKISFVVGSSATFFSLSGIGLPLAGIGRAGTLVATGVALTHLAFKICFAGVWPSLHLLAFIIPGWCAGLYWASRSAWIRVGIPLLCFALFTLHPVGFWATPYALYWLVPIILFYTGYSTIFATALGSTFTAHAVGSVIWLYTMPMTVGNWYMLIPVVIAERLFYAIGMTLLVRLAQWIETKSSYIPALLARLGVPQRS